MNARDLTHRDISLDEVRIDALFRGMISIEYKLNGRLFNAEIRSIRKSNR